jgi:hypothetical protein
MRLGPFGRRDFAPAGRMGNLIPALTSVEVSPSPVYGARLLSGLRANPSRGFKSRHLRHAVRQLGVTFRTCPDKA